MPENLDGQELPAGQVSHWLNLLKSGDSAAAQPLWEQYFSRLVGLVQKKMPHPGALDANGVAASAFLSFYARASQGQFPRLADRHDLWALLVTITARKVIDHLVRENALKRGGGKHRVDAEALDSVVSREPTAEFAAMVIEEFNELLKKLDNETFRNIAVWKMEGYTNQQIAERLDCSIRTVAYKLELIREILKR